MTKYCPKCNITRDRDTKFCQACGTSLKEIQNCICGKEIYIRDNFCTNCGRPVQIETNCKRCDGEGKVPSETDIDDMSLNCPECQGDGCFTCKPEDAIDAAERVMENR